MTVHHEASQSCQAMPNPRATGYARNSIELPRWNAGISFIGEYSSGICVCCILPDLFEWGLAQCRRNSWCTAIDRLRYANRTGQVRVVAG